MNGDPMKNWLLQILFNQWLQHIKNDRVDLLESELAQAIESLKDGDGNSS